MDVESTFCKWQSRVVRTNPLPMNCGFETAAIGGRTMFPVRVAGVPIAHRHIGMS